MNIKILINAVDPEECRIATVKDSKLVQFHIDSASRAITRGNIYKGTVSRVESGLQATFLDYGAERNGFLQKNEIHSDYFQDITSGKHTIKNMIKRGQDMLVQVVKDPIMHKGAMLTTFISLAGRYIVLMPGSTTRGVSRQVSDETERARLKDIVDKLKIQDGFGAIIRTAGIDCTKAVIAKDLNYLLKLWKNIIKKGQKKEAPALLYKDRSFVVRSLRDYLTPDVSEILIDDETVYNEVRDFVNIISPKQARIVKHFKGPKPIFTKYQLETQIASIFEKQVKLKSGGTIVIQQTEALVSIDVNSGKDTHKKNIEQTALQTNLEAAEEIAGQLQLRDLGGLIVIDFIDMRESKHNSEVVRTLKKYLMGDKARGKVGTISKFGMLEMSRQRLKPSIEYGSYQTCRHCQGKGMMPSTETLALGLLRQLRLETLKENVMHVKAYVPNQVSEYILNRKRNEINDLEIRREILITIEGDEKMVPGESRIVCEKKTVKNSVDSNSITANGIPSLNSVL
ncbi:MAG: ribonuclease E/G [Desulfobacterales bacterium]|nr:ribonuclease E/G [Desulfobacterales bacterium]